MILFTFLFSRATAAIEDTEVLHAQLSVSNPWGVKILQLKTHNGYFTDYFQL